MTTPSTVRSIAPSGFIASDAGARLQFTRINAILRRAIDRMADGTDTLARVKAQISALRDHDEGQLPAAQNSMRGVKAAALAELTRFEQDRSTSHDTADVAQVGAKHDRPKRPRNRPACAIARASLQLMLTLTRLHTQRGRRYRLPSC